MDERSHRLSRLTRQDVIDVVGALDDARIAAIIATGATAEELAEAFIWLSKDTDLMGERERSLSGTVAEVYDILIGDEEFPEEP